MQTKISLPPDQVYDILTEADNSRVFRSIKVPLVPVLLLLYTRSGSTTRSSQC